jgi:predicted phosphoadenosine phosphosulfate sulfurtransferase
MSKGYWRTGKPIEQFNPGNCATERVSEYVQAWKRRCYSVDIPDEVPRKVQSSGRAPSWKAIAIAILQNDLQLRQLGFSPINWEKQKAIAAKAHFAFNGYHGDGHQLELFQ